MKCSNVCAGCHSICSLEQYHSGTCFCGNANHQWQASDYVVDQNCNSACDEIKTHKTQGVSQTRRPTWHETWMEFAHTVACRSHDSRLKVGAIVVADDNTAVLALGYKFIDNEQETIDIQGGLDYAFGKYEIGDKEEYVAPRTELNYRYKFNENVYFKQMLSYLFSLEDEEKYFASSESAVGVKMTKALSLGVSYRIDYVNQTEKENSDRRLLTSIIVDF